MSRSGIHIARYIRTSSIISVEADLLLLLLLLLLLCWVARTEQATKPTLAVRSLARLARFLLVLH